MKSSLAGKSLGSVVLALTLTAAAVAGDGASAPDAFKFEAYLEASFNLLSSDGVPRSN